MSHSGEPRSSLKGFDPPRFERDPISPTNTTRICLEEQLFFQPLDGNPDDEALRDWESEGGAVPASSLPTPS